MYERQVLLHTFLRMDGNKAPLPRRAPFSVVLFELELLAFSRKKIYQKMEQKKGETRHDFHFSDP